MLKESDLIKGHKYVSRNVTVVYGVMNKREILKVNSIEGYVTYCEIKGIKNGMKASIKTISIKSFLKWATADVTSKEEK